MKNNQDLFDTVRMEICFPYEEIVEQIIRKKTEGGGI